MAGALVTPLNVTVVVVDATRLERNLNLVLQVLEITDRVVVCLNLMDEAYVSYASDTGNATDNLRYFAGRGRVVSVSYARKF